MLKFSILAVCCSIPLYALIAGRTPKKFRYPGKEVLWTCLMAFALNLTASFLLLTLLGGLCFWFGLTAQAVVAFSLIPPLVLVVLVNFCLTFLIAICEAAEWEQMLGDTYNEGQVDD